MSKVIVTGFKPFSLLTWLTDNPSEIIAKALGSRYGSQAHVSILNADATCLTEISSLVKTPDLRAILMLGAAVQASPIVLELEGVSKSGGLLGPLQNKFRSSGAERLQEYAKSLGVPSATAPITPFVYWCLRSYAAALEWTEPRSIPCIFLHANTLRLDSNTQIDIAAKFFEKVRD